MGVEVLVVVVGVLVAALLAAVLVRLRRLGAPSPALAASPPRAAPLADTPDLAQARTTLAQAHAALDDARRELADVQQQRGEAEQQLAGLRADAAARRAEAAVQRDHVAELRADVERREHRLAEREERLDVEHHRLDAEQRRLDLREEALAAHETLLEERAAQLELLAAERQRELERVAALSAADAKAELVAGLEQQAKREAQVLIRDLEAAARETAEQRARAVVVTAIQRVASEQTSESVVTVLHLPADEMKGRIIGREGRNIRAFESVTGVNLIIDDTPEAVLLSCFDPVRREVARIALQQLVDDGRIHPHRIEEAHERAKAEVETLCVRAGEDALVEVGLTDMHPDLVALLGRLRYRTSYGQNVLKHLVESAHIAGMMAAELGMDVTLLKRCALLHDVGKALTHEVGGSHALIGAELAHKYGECDDVVHAIEAHHNEVEMRTVEAVLTQAADAISGGRPGARRESLEHYVKRLERIEEIASEQAGVEKVFAMQAGREIRVMVKPEDVDDIGAQVIARDIAKQIEEELTYPGQIRVTVVRESRATEIAK